MCYSNTYTDFYLYYVMYLVNEETRKPEKLKFDVTLQTKRRLLVINH
jgi:hypothetical protein